MSFSGVRGVVMVLAAIFAVSSVNANETDQFTLPVDKEFADLGSYFTAAHYKALSKVVDSTNKKIRAALKLKDPIQREDRLKKLYSGAALADGVRGHFGAGLFEMNGLEDKLRSRKLKKQYPGKILAYRTGNWVYSFAHFPLDPRNFPLLFASSTVRVYGVYVGTDKFGHFHDLGHIYYKDYLRHRGNGMTDEQATARVVRDFSKGPISEAATIGFWATGVLSNADLASNYLGFKFYRNLTEPVMFQGSLQPPLVVRDGDFWKLNWHVKPDNDFFKVFISDHLNEALNPCVYELGLRQAIRRRLKKDADNILTVYSRDGRPRMRSYYQTLAENLSTYFGEDYGHTAFSPSKMPSIASCCFPDESGQDTDEPQRPAPKPQAVAEAKSAPKSKAAAAWD